MSLPVAILLLVLAGVAARTLGLLRLAIWQVMVLGAAAVLLTGGIAPLAAARSVDPSVMVFLAAMFLLGEAMERSGYLAHLAGILFARAGSVDALVLMVMFGAGAASALFMNDTLAVIGTPLVLILACKRHVEPRLLLLALAFAVTLGSVMSPIGNPQNLLIAVHGGMPSPFVSFFGWLGVPTLINLLLAYGVLRLRFRKHFHRIAPGGVPPEVSDPPLAWLARAGMLILLGLVGVRIALRAAGVAPDLPLAAAAAVAAAPLLLFSRRRLELLRNLDWATLVFFAALFILVRSVWDTGFFQGWVDRLHPALGSVPTVLMVSVFLSQVLSNVPLVALYLPLLIHGNASEAVLLALAAGSTVAGNLFILGAASNVIIAQGAERRGVSALSFSEFASTGVPLTLINLAVYWAYFHWVYASG